MATELSIKQEEPELKIVDIGEGCVYLESSGAIVEKRGYTSGVYEDDEYSLSDDYFVGQRRHRWHNEIEPWGIHNWKPQEILATVSNHAYLPGLLNVKTILAIAQGLQTYEKRQEGDEVVNIPILDQELEDWFEELEVNEFAWQTAVDVSHWAGGFTQVITNKRGNEVRDLVRLDVTNCRVDQVLRHTFVYETWQDILNHSHYTKLPLYKKGEKQKNFAVQAKNMYPGSRHYPVNPAWGAINWIKFANEIPIFKLASIKNGFTIKYHIRIPVDYFLITYPEGKTFDKDRKLVENIHAFRKEKELELYTNLNKYLSGARNANKIVTSRTWIDPVTQKPINGLEIEAIEDNYKYDAFIEDLEASDTRILSSQNLFPSIAGIKTINKLGGGGSETRNDFNIASQVLTTQPQELILKPLKIAKKITFPNKKNIHLGFKALELATTDLVKSGFITNKLQ